MDSEASELTVVKRPLPAMMGQQLDVITNCVEIRLPSGMMYKYYVDILSASDSKKAQTYPQKTNDLPTNINMKIIDALNSQHRQSLGGNIVAFDGSRSLFSRNKLPFEEAEFENIRIEYDGQFQMFFVCLRYLHTISLDVLKQPIDAAHVPTEAREACQMLDVIIRNGPSLSNLPVGMSSFYSSVDRDRDYTIGRGCEVRHGFKCSLIMDMWKPLINIDVVANVFYTSGPLLDFIAGILDKKSVSDIIAEITEEERNTVVSKIHSLYITATHLGSKRRHRINGLTQNSALESTFDWNDQNITVAQYFYEKYNITLKYPHLPLAIVGSRGDMFPLEICEIIPGQPFTKPLDDNQTATFNEITTINPEERLRHIRAAVSNLKRSSSDYFEAFDIHMVGSLMAVPARVIPPPVITHGGNRISIVENGAWRSEKFIIAANMKKWAIVNMGTVESDKIREMIQLLKDEGQKLGMHIYNPVYEESFGPSTSPRVVLDCVRKKHPDIQMTLVILASTSDYKTLKAEAETTGICMRTQCVLDSSVTNNLSPQLAINLLQKINIKMGGQNCGLQGPLPISFQEPFMIIGIDIVSQPIGEKHVLSVSAVVASIDYMPCKYYALTLSHRLSKGYQVQYVAQIKDMLLECLNAFYDRNEELPLHLFIFRTGDLGDSVDRLLTIELQAIRAACSEFTSRYTPTVTIILVHRDHNLRFMSVTENEENISVKNIPPGTVIDCRVVNPEIFDFYLCSHHAETGTVRPTHYQVIHDDVPHCADDIYTICYSLCHGSARCTQSLSVPVPMSYANLAACRRLDHYKGRLMFDRARCSESEKNDFNIPEVVIGKMRGEMYFI